MSRLWNAPWLVAGAALLAGLELFVAVGIWVDRFTEDSVALYEGTTVRVPSETGPLYGDLLLTGLIGGAALAVIAGLYLRSRRPVVAHRLIVGGLIPAALSGLVFWWFPPFWIASVVAVAVMIGVSLKPRTTEPVRA